MTTAQPHLGARVAPGEGAVRRPAAGRRPAAPETAALHPLAWWAWGMGVAVALTRTENPLVVGLMLASVGLVVAACRDDTPWARAFRAYLVLGAVIVVVRVLFYLVVGLPDSSAVVLHLPTVRLPAWVDSIALLGPVHAAGLLGALYAGLRLAALVVTFGAVNALANPKRALRSLPASLHHLGTAVVIAVTVTPQLVTAVGRVRRAQRLRGLDGRGVRAFGARLVPVLQDALDSALALAGSMDSRGYARGARPGGDRRVGVALVVALVALVAGTYGLLDAGTPDLLGVGLVAGGAVVGVVASVLAGRQVLRTRYRPDPWGWRETAVAVCGVAAAMAVVVGAATDPASTSAGLSPLRWPELPLAGLAAAVLATLPVAVPGMPR